MPLTFGYFWLNYLGLMGLPRLLLCPLLHYLCLTLVGIFRNTPSPFGFPTIFDLSRSCLRLVSSAAAPIMPPFPFPSSSATSCSSPFRWGATASWPRNAYSSACEKGANAVSPVKNQLGRLPVSQMRDQIGVLFRVLFYSVSFDSSSLWPFEKAFSG